MVCGGDNPEKENQREEEENQQKEKVSWSAYHANLQPHTESSQARVTQTSLLLFHDQAHSATMICHSMDVVKKAVENLNPGQLLVIAMDQPLYVLAKQIQWNWNTSHGENQFVVMFGALRIEMAALKALGTLLDGSGWTGALVEANIASSGTADSFLHAPHVTHTRRAHQITASSLYILKKAFLDYQAVLKMKMPNYPLNIGVLTSLFIIHSSNFVSCPTD